MYPLQTEIRLDSLYSMKKMFFLLYGKQLGYVLWIRLSFMK